MQNIIPYILLTIFVIKHSLNMFLWDGPHSSSFSTVERSFFTNQRLLILLINKTSHFDFTPVISI